MNSSAFSRLTRVLDLEERQEWRNRAVIGGISAMADRWAEDARAENLDEQLIDALVREMQAYGDAAPETRPDIANRIRRLIDGDLLPDIATVVPETGDEEPLEIPVGNELPGSGVSQAAQPPQGKEDKSKKTAAKRNNGPGLGTVYESDDDEDTVDDESGEQTTQAKAQSEAGTAQARLNAEDLQADVTTLAGIGKVTAEQLARLNIHKVIDLLWHFPARYDDYSEMRTIDKLVPGEQVTVIANLWDFRERKISMKRTVVQGILGDSTGTLHATWWTKWIGKKLQTGKTMRFSGKVGLYMGQKTLDNPVFEDVEDDLVATGRLSPVYALTEGLSNNRLRTIIRDVVGQYVDLLTDPLPNALHSEYDLLDLATTIRQIHFPDNQASLARARRRLAFEELFYVQLGVLQRRRLLQSSEAPPLVVSEDLLEQYAAALPFALTVAQQRVLDEIVRDLQRSIPMTRLVQGDVGSGKTAVAAATIWIAATNGVQSALLAPTQILAEQHFRGISTLLGTLNRPDGSPLRVALLTGRVVGAAREEVLAALGSGEIDLVVGTTALVQEGVEFANLGLVIVDEQHRFGVEQRGALRSKVAGQPHVLVMSATPIPRSLALTVYGDLDISRIDEMPPGRIEIKTKLFTPAERERLYSFVRREVVDGRQVYIVYPLVAESEVLDAGAATAEHKRLQEEVFSDLRVALLHGRMTGTEKDEVMRAFAAGEHQILVSTTVIEVGIDVPNASVILVEDADRFGLAQLHQLRGRVGRGQHASYCALVTKADSDNVLERLRVLADTNDGFVLAEKDLELRGPGDFLGTRQSGLPELRIAQLTDTATIALAREAAQGLFDGDPELSGHTMIADQVSRFWRGHGDVS